MFHITDRGASLQDTFYILLSAKNVSGFCGLIDLHVNTFTFHFSCLLFFCYTSFIHGGKT